VAPRRVDRKFLGEPQRWLESRGFTLPSINASRARADASPPHSASTSRRRPSENCLDVVVDSKARAILDILTQVDSADAREQPGVMNRVLRLLGLKEPASA
jgi:hypothetical protein